MDCATDRSPAFAAANAVNSAPPRTAAVAPVKMIVPLPRSSICRAAACPTTKPARHPSRQTFSNIAGSISANGLPVLRAGIEDGDIQAPERRDVIEQRVNLIVEAKVRRPRHRLAALGRDLLGDAFQLLFLAGDQYRHVAGSGESARNRLAETVADPGDEGEGPATHPATPSGRAAAAAPGGCHEADRFGASQRRNRPAPCAPTNSNSRQIASPRNSVATGQPVTFDPFVVCVVHLVVEDVDAHGDLAIGVPDREVGVGSDSDGALARV